MRGGNLVSNRLCGVSVTIIIRACCARNSWCRSARAVRRSLCLWCAWAQEVCNTVDGLYIRDVCV